MTESERRLLSNVCQLLVNEHAVAAGGIVEFRLFTPLYDARFRESLHVCLCQFPSMTVFAAGHHDEAA